MKTEKESVRNKEPKFLFYMIPRDIKISNSGNRSGKKGKAALALRGGGDGTCQMSMGPRYFILWDHCSSVSVSFSSGLILRVL